MAQRYRRDLIGHFIRKKQRTQQPCTHACCRGYRVHPDNYPVILPDRTLHRASDEDLAKHYVKVSQGDSPKDGEARLQILYEMERRDEREVHREQVEQRRRERWAARKMEQEELLEWSWLQAEEATKGNMLNKLGREMDVNERSLFTGPESRARKYASEELLEYWQTHPRPTAAMLRGEDTRLYEQYSAPRKQRRVTRRMWAA